ncbi:MAG: hypothetical protein EOO43_09730 [Flavobacterium sp.]|nr:MAG: hypothetical protein EOO43_09730 [Flavobacterium sp.]
MKILGIHDGHNASACLMVNGKTEYLIQEERVACEKNRSGFPALAIDLILKKSGLNFNEIDCIGMNGTYMPAPTNRQETLDYYNSLLKGGTLFNSSLIKNRLKSVPFIAGPYEKGNKQRRQQKLASLGVDSSKVNFIDHHTLHAYTAYCGNGDFKNDVLVLTNDGAGDRLCATVNVFRNGQMERIASVHENHSIGILYAVFTYLTGMVPLEHEYKIMGMAPYAHKSGSQKVSDEFWEMFEFSEDGLTWEFKKGFSVFGSMEYFKDFMFLKRFDYLMAGLQYFTEQFLVHWVRACIKKTGIKKIALAGGTFMNVKADKLIMEMEEVEKVFVFPSCGDESNALGACYYLEAKHNGFKSIQKLDDVYFGISFTNEDVKKSYEKYSFKNTYTIKYHDDIEHEIAKILASNNVVSRFKGKEEFGARSLGNRAIIANPNHPDVIKEINEMIKNRDFWMPFACSILDSDFDKYVISEGKNDPYYMIMTFDTKPAADEIKGGIHPYDRTVRPQIVTQKHNASYWNLINEFKKITGIGGILNTSLNLSKVR